MTMLELEVRAKESPARDFVGDPVGIAVAPLAAHHAKCVGGEEMLRLVQRVFLVENGDSPKQVVVCGIDRDNGSSSICAKAGQALAANSALPVCIVDANARLPLLSGMFGFNRMTT